MPTNPELRQFIVDHFNDAELTILIADYFKQYRDDERPGLGLKLRAQELIDYCNRLGQLASLRAALQEERPEPWQTEFGALAVAPVVRRARDPRKCFVSYAHEDVEFAEKLAGDLRTAGVPVWIAPHSIQPGEKWMRAIERGLKECGVFLCVLTPNALASEWVRDETDIAIGYAKKGDMRLLPLLVKACDPAELSVWLTPLQHIPFGRRYESGLMELKNALGLAAPTSPTPAAAVPTITPPSQAAGRSKPAVGNTTSAALSVDDMPMCYVPSGEFIMGGKGQYDGKPEHVQNVMEGFWMGQYPITNAQFAQFVSESGYAREGFWIDARAAGRWSAGKFLRWNGEWRDGSGWRSVLLEIANYPTTGISWYEALAFAEWLRSRFGIVTFGLPSEVQWEYAARGPRYAPGMITPVVRPARTLLAVAPWTLKDLGKQMENVQTSVENRRIYPWGDDADRKKMNFRDTGIGTTCAVGTFPSGASLFGCEDMSGNVWEWTMTKTTDDYNDYDRNVDNQPDGSEARRVLRGGAFDSIEDYARCACRNYNRPNLDDASIGFRVVASPTHL